MLWWTVQNFAISAVLAAVVAAVCRIGRLGPVARHGLWLVVLVKLLTPSVVFWPWAFHRPVAVTVTQKVPIAVAPRPVAAEFSHYVVHRPDAPLPAPIQQAIPAVAAPMKQAAPPPVPAPRIDWSSVALHVAVILWLMGAIAFAAIQLIRIVRMLLRLRLAREADADFQECVDDLAGRLKLKRPIRARIVRGLTSPVVFSIVRPQLLWPVDLPTSITASARHGLVLHELAHVKRGDHHVGWLELIAGCLWWWNPLFWYVRHQLRENAELACDAWAVQTLPRGRRAYAEGLLAVCESLRDSFQKRRPSPLPAVGINTGGRQFLERRLTMLFRDQVPLRLGFTGWLSLLLVALGALPALSQKSAEPTPTRSTQDLGIGLEGQTEVRGILTLGHIQTALPADAQKLVDQSHADQERARSEYEKKIAESRENLIGGLQKLQEKYTKAGKLDEAVAIRDHIRQLQRGGVTTAVPITPGVPIPTGPIPNSPVPIDPGSLNPNLSAYRGQDGKTIDVSITGTTQGTVWGSDPYTDDSSLGAAAVHAGVLKDGETRILRVRILPGQPSYQGSTRNGITSEDYGPWPGSFRFEQPLHGYRDNPDQITTLQSFRDHPSVSIIMQLTGSTKGQVWGTDVYTDDSDPATAAVHAGVLKDGEKGMVLITTEPGQSSYTGSTRNGVTTESWRSWGGSFRVQRVESQPGAGSTGAPPSVELEHATREVQRF